MRQEHTDDKPVNPPSNLRGRAEKMLRKQAADLANIAPEEVKHLFHELQVHQIELEVQNEEMCRLQEQLLVSREKYFDLYDLAPVGYLTISEKGLIVEANLTVVNLLGLERDYLISKPVTRFIVKEDQDIYYLHRKQLLETQAPQVCELRMLRKGGAPFWARIEAIVAQGSEDAPLCWTTVSDITERKRAEEERLEMERRLQQTQKLESLGLLAGGVAHDFNNLLMIVRGYTELLLDSGELSPGLQRNAEQIAKAAERASGLTHQLLAFSRKQVLAPQVLDLNTVVAGVDKMLHRLIGEDIELVTRPCAGLWHVKADPGQLEQVLLNLAINARDAMPRGGRLTLETRNVELDARFVRHHSGSRPGQHVLLTVSDNGAGMPPDVRSRIFEPFFTTKEVGRGTGLGLATVYGIVKQSNGYITVESEPGQGTTFHIYLPRAEEELLPAVESRERATVAGGTETILLVEDQQDVRALACEFLGRQGYRVLEARSGPEALQVSGQHAGEIHVLVTDVIMPGMSGRELVDQLAPARPQMKVLYVSGYTDEAIGKHGILEPGTEFLQKPFSRESLARKLRDMLDNGG